MSTVDATKRPASFLEEASVVDDPAGQIPGMPPNYGAYPLSHSITFLSMSTSGARTYRDYDQAMQASLDNARNMRNDCGVMECLEARQRCTALLDWQLEPEDESSHDQQELCKELTRVLQRTRRFTEYRRSLQEALWYGKAGIQHRFGYEMVNGQQRLTICPKHADDLGWKPIHGDKIVFRLDAGDLPEGGYHGQLGIRVGQTLLGDRIQGRWNVEATERGMAYFLKPWERSLITVHRHMIEDTAFESQLDAGAINGVGIRSRIYWEWFQKQECLAFLMEYLERSAGGIELWHYPQGNAQAKAEVEQAARQRIGNGRNLLLIPIPPGDEGHQYGVQVVEPGMAGIETLHQILKEYYGHRIKRYILGQILSSESDATGLGSGVADLHLDTLMQIIRYDASNLEETITWELVRELQKRNFPKSLSHLIRFRIVTDTPDLDKKLGGWMNAWQMGARIKERDVMDLIGASIPGPDDRVLQAPQAQAPGSPAGAAAGQPSGQPVPPAIQHPAHRQPGDVGLQSPAVPAAGV